MTSSSPDDRCMVAEVGSRVLGLAHVHRVPFLTESAYRARLTALVVEEAERSRGIGALLLQAAEQATRDMGAAVLELTTSSRRERAHHFYERSGYIRPSRHYQKALVPPEPKAYSPAAEPTSAEHAAEAADGTIQ
ncbi:GNAT family N-acetyltransferase [Arthrobacter sp. USHLN218]|uniref:GNAT family N-acetyltransferase n=1 Tax=Arthrobacter sp. USHLN218 TaxID=3081232 RepID=UPI003FA59AC6